MSAQKLATVLNDLLCEFLVITTFDYGMAQTRQEGSFCAEGCNRQTTTVFPVQGVACSIPVFVIGQT